MFPDEFEDYKKILLVLLNMKKLYHFEDSLIELYKTNEKVQQLIAEGMTGMEAINAAVPHTFVSAGNRLRTENGEEVAAPAWYYLLHDYTVTPSDLLFDLFLAYRLRNADLMQLDAILNYLLENYYDGNITIFGRVLKLTIRKHGGNLLVAEQTDTISEWIAAKEKEAASVTEDTAGKGRIKRIRDDKITILNQEQIALLIYCLQQTDIILKDKLLNRKDAGLAFSILTGYSPDTIRQNLSKDEIMAAATAKNAVAVRKALQTVLDFIDNTIMPE